MAISGAFEEMFGVLGTSDIALGEYNRVSQNTLIQGDLSSSESLVVLGVVQGDLSSDRQVLLQGKVQGEIHCSNLLIQGGVIKGNLYVRGDLAMDEKAIVIGQVNAENAVIDGKLKGDLNAQKKVILQAHSYVVGDITGGNFFMGEGARFDGMVKIRSPKNGEREAFPEISFE